MATPIWFAPFAVEELNERAKETLSDLLQIRFIEKGEDFLTAIMPVQKSTCQPMGILHGGASAALAETVGSAAANYCVDQNSAVCVGLELNINHLKSVREGWITATARPFHLGRTTQVWEIALFDITQKRVAISRLTLSVLQK